MDDPSSERLRRKWSIDRYVNSGVMLIDLSRWRARDLTRRCIEFSLAQGAQLEFLDQCAINAVLAGDITLLDPRWNVCVTPRTATTGAESAAVLHFITGEKPWQAWYESPLGRQYWRYLDVSPWAGATAIAPTTPHEKVRLARLLATQGRLRESLDAYADATTRPRPPGQTPKA